MELIIVYEFDKSAAFVVSQSEAAELLKLDKQMMNDLSTGNFDAAKYKRDIQLRDGTKLLGALLNDFRVADNGRPVAYFHFDEIIEKEN